MKYLKICLFFVSIYIFIPLSAAAEDQSMNVQDCMALAEEINCDEIYASCLALLNALDRESEKNAKWREVCDFGIIEISICSEQVGTDNIGKFCKCIQDEAGCPKVSIGKCIADFTAQAQMNRQALRLLDAFDQCGY
jgi:hypothetical protein